jgi:glycosyltransferase involved in cell wall biosynthesis
VDEIDIAPQQAERFGDILGADVVAEFTARMAEVGQRLAGGTIWHVNSTGEGGGVAEMLQSIGGIQDQIEPGVSGLLVEPDDLAGFGEAVTGLFRDRDTAVSLGDAAQARVRAEYLAPRYLDRYFRLLLEVVPDRA